MVQEKALKVVIICGPTAAGKTEAALRLARRLPVEIVNADSGQIYRGMDIGTAKPTPEERRSVPYHLLDLVDPSEAFSAAQFRERARSAIVEIAGRGRIPLVVGGTGLYIKVLLGGIAESPPADPVIRNELERRFLEEGAESLHRELAAADPSAAAAIPAQNRQRLIRALEVFRLTGRPISSFWEAHRFQDSPYRVLKIGLMPQPEELERRIRSRVESMVSRGLFEEAAALIARYGRAAPGLLRIGYREAIAFLDGKMSRDEAIALIGRRTRQYAKRQRTWFGRDLDIVWHAAYDGPAIEDSVSRFA